MSDNLKYQIRKLDQGDLSELLTLYGFLNPGDPTIQPEDRIYTLWDSIVRSPWLHYFGASVDRLLISTCHLAVIPNLTRGARPYGVIENVVTHPDYRLRGVGTKVLKHALKTAWNEDCYKVLLQTGTKTEGKLRFYEKAGFQRGQKTGFVAYPNVIDYS